MEPNQSLNHFPFRASLHPKVPPLNIQYHCPLNNVNIHLGIKPFIIQFPHLSFGPLMCQRVSSRDITDNAVDKTPTVPRFKSWPPERGFTSYFVSLTKQMVEPFQPIVCSNVTIKQQYFTFIHKQEGLCLRSSLILHLTMLTFLIGTFSLKSGYHTISQICWPLDWIHILPVYLRCFI